MHISEIDIAVAAAAAKNLLQREERYLEVSIVGSVRVWAEDMDASCSVEVEMGGIDVFLYVLLFLRPHRLLFLLHFPSANQN